MNCIDIAIDLIDKAEKPLRIAKWKGEDISEQEERDVTLITGALCEFIQIAKKEGVTSIATKNINPLRGCKINNHKSLIQIQGVNKDGSLRFKRNAKDTYNIFILLRIRECLLDDNSPVRCIDISKEFNVNDGTVSKLVYATKIGMYEHVFKEWDEIQQNPLRYDKTGQLIF